ncbi:MAG: hypothetical protein HYS98_04120 [Deltaproteobacteria bacterium]|nr:hypothetical protein [Deltaproteobacteria bacterium]
MNLKTVYSRAKFLKKLNILDVLIILNVFFLIPMFYFGYKMYMKAHQTSLGILMGSSAVTFYQVQIPCLFLKVNSELLKKMAIGDVEKNETGEVIGEIVLLKKPQPYTEIQRFGRHTYIYYLPLVSPENLSQIPAVLNLTVFKHNSYPFYKNKKYLVKPKQLLDFKTDQYELSCMVTDLNFKNTVQIVLP